VDIHEYQAKELLAGFGVPIPKGGVAYSADQAVYRASEIGGTRWVVKAQIHSGARGRAGGIRVCPSDSDVRQAAKELLGKTLVTTQTGPEGLPVHRLLVEQALPIARELYVGLVLDRRRERVVVVAHPHGGMEIEEIAQREPAAILREEVEPAVGMQTFQARELAFGLGLDPAQVSRAVTAILGAYRAFRELDATMVEINPLVVTTEGQVLALDVKMSFDDNAMFRRPHVAELRDYAQEDPREAEAAEHGLNYVALEGDIGCIINGAGLAMATMDMIQHAGGEPANFLDIGGGASPDRVAAAFRLVLSDRNVRAILVNVFAGINRCDWVAEGVVQAVREVQVPVPLVVRLAGTNVDEGRRILRDSGLPIVTADTLAEAADRVVAARSSPPDPLSVPERGDVLRSPSPEEPALGVAQGRGEHGVR
jgi:malate-CoA ligase subunit beta